MGKRWDNLDIVRAVDEVQQTYGGGPAYAINGLQLMEMIAGSIVTEQHEWRGFVHELHIAEDAGLLTFTIETSPGSTPPNPNSQPHYYLQLLRNFALTIAGQDRARGRLVVQPVQDPSEDDGRPISRLIISQIAMIIGTEYSPEQVATFLRESGVPLGENGFAQDLAESDAEEVLIALERWASEGRRILRRFIARWLEDQLISGPTNEQRVQIVDRLARQGWYVRNGNLVVGDPATGRNASSPVLRDVRLAALHPIVAAAGAKYFIDGHRATAVFEAMKAVSSHVRTITNQKPDGVSLMNLVFSAKSPQISLGDPSTESGRSVHDGYRFLFVGAQQAFRNPLAHDLFQDIGENEALEQLALASLLMRAIDRAAKFGDPGQADLSGQVIST